MNDAWFDANLMDGHDRITAGLAPGEWLLPAGIALDGDDLVYWWDPDVLRSDTPGNTARSVYQPKEKGLKRHLLDSFTRLRKDSPKRVGDFARRYGVLLLCEHAKPVTHAGHDSPRCRPYHSDPDGTYHEPLAIWDQYARKAEAFVDVIAYVRKKEPAPREVWSVINGEVPEELTLISGREARLSAEHRLLGRELDAWSRLTDQRQRLEPVPIVAKDAERPSEHGTRAPRLFNPTLTTNTLFGGLVQQLTMLTTGTANLATCWECGRLYMPDRFPVEGKRNFCPNCGKPAARRAAQRDFRERHPGYADRYRTRKASDGDE